MQTRQLGNSGTKTSALGIGAMSFSDFYGPTTEQNSFAILDAAMSAGVTHIDTSNVYGAGHSERIIGAYLQSRGAGARDHFVIATKAGITRDEAGNRFFDNSAAHLEAELDHSLQRLGVDCVDLFYVHRREADRPIEEVAETMAALVKKGKVKAIGFSEIAPSSLRRAAAVTPIAAVQSEFSLATRFVELGLIQACAELGTALVAFSPVGRSLLTNSPLRGEALTASGFLRTNPRFTGQNHLTNLAQTDKFRAAAAEIGLPAASVAIAWLLAQGPHVLPIPGTRSTAHFAELVQGAEATLTAEDLALIDTVLPIGWAHGDRYDDLQLVGPERFS